MNRQDVQEWLDRYVAAWRANEPDPIRELFAEDATYSYRPWLGDDQSVRGREAIVASWLENPDDPGAWEARYEPYAVEGDRAVAVGWSRYAASGDQPERTYHNAYVLRFTSDGRCAEFREFYMQEGK
jgi:ketosteroid isomerase-like protein